MFDPRTLPNGDFWPNLGLFVAYAGLLLDTVVAYIGSAKGKATKTVWIGPVSPFGAFLNAGIIRTALIFAAAAVLGKLGVMNNAHAYVEWLLAVPGFASAVHNFIILQKK